MSNFISFFSGKKTYIVGALTILLGILQGNSQMIMSGIGMITIRMGIAKVTPTPSA